MRSFWRNWGTNSISSRQPNLRLLNSESSGRNSTWKLHCSMNLCWCCLQWGGVAALWRQPWQSWPLAGAAGRGVWRVQGRRVLRARGRLQLLRRPGRQQSLRDGKVWGGGSGVQCGWTQQLGLPGAGGVVKLLSEGLYQGGGSWWIVLWREGWSNPALARSPGIHDDVV